MTAMTNNTYEKIVNEWRSRPLNSPADVNTVLDNFRVLFAYNSNKIENPDTTYHDTREIFQNGRVTGYTGELRTLFEIQNQKNCYGFLRDKIASREPVTPDLIKETHRILMAGCYDGDGVGAAPEDVQCEMESLCQEIEAVPTDRAITAAAYFHLKFESIHPFADGNGRTGRTLMNYYLMTHGHPPTIIYDEDKVTYYMALAVYDKAEEISGFEDLLREQTVKTWTRTPRPGKKLTMFL